MSEPAPSVVVCEACGKKNRVPPEHGGVPRCGNCGAPLPWIVDAADSTFEQVAEAASIPVLVDFWAPWCGPCRAMTPALERLAKRFAGRIKLVRVNVDEAASVSGRFEVRGVPMLMMLDHGRLVSKRVGSAPSEDALREWIEQALDAPVRSS